MSNKTCPLTVISVPLPRCEELIIVENRYDLLVKFLQSECSILGNQMLRMLGEDTYEPETVGGPVIDEGGL